MFFFFNLIVQNVFISNLNLKKKNMDNFYENVRRGEPAVDSV